MAEGGTGWDLGSPPTQTIPGFYFQCIPFPYSASRSHPSPFILRGILGIAPEGIKPRKSPSPMVLFLLWVTSPMQGATQPTDAASLGSLGTFSPLENPRVLFGWKETLGPTQSHTLPSAGTPSTIPDCSEPHPTLAQPGGAAGAGGSWDVPKCHHSLAAPTEGN